MGHYERAMKHWRNHSKDRFTQPCGGPTREPEDPVRHDIAEAIVRISLEKIAETTSEYPIYIVQISGGVYVCANERNSFATKIGSREELDNFIAEYL